MLKIYGFCENEYITDHYWRPATVMCVRVLLLSSCVDRLVGLVVKASASRAEGPGFESR